MLHDLEIFFGGSFNTIEWDKQPWVLKIESEVFLNVQVDSSPCRDKNDQYEA